MVALVAAVFVLGQFIEGNLVTPAPGRRADPRPSGLADLRGARRRGAVRPARRASGGAGGRGARRVACASRSSATGRALWYDPAARAMSDASSSCCWASSTRPPRASRTSCRRACNREALAWLERWPDWPAPALVLHGPPGCGKSHLARIWAARSGAAPARSGSAAAPASEPRRAPRCSIPAEPVADELALLQLYNRLREQGGPSAADRAPAGRRLVDPPAGPRLAPARGARGRDRRARRRRCWRRCWSSCSPTASSPSPRT